MKSPQDKNLILNYKTMKEAIAVLLFYAYFVFAWIVNVYQFFNLDFEPGYKDEIIKFIGIIIPPLSSITVWL